MAGARKPAQDQCPLVVVARGNELLGHKIHAVVEGRDQAQVRGLVVSLDFLMRVMPLQVNDRLPTGGLKAPIDSVSFGPDIPQKIVIALDVGAARVSDLHE